MTALESYPFSHPVRGPPGGFDPSALKAGTSWPRMLPADFGSIREVAKIRKERRSRRILQEQIGSDAAPQA